MIALTAGRIGRSCPDARRGREMRNVKAGRKLGLLGLLMLGGAAAVTYGSYRQDIARARERVASGSQVVETRCGAIEYAVAGEGSPVLAVHGAGGGYDQGMDFGGPLAERGFRVIAMSRFGYLRTPLRAESSAAAQADAHACLLDALEIPRAAVLGGSAGSPSSVQLALRHPERVSALVLVVPALFVPRDAGAPSLHTPAATRWLFDTALRSDFLFWAALRLARPAMIRGLLATPPEALANASPDEQARVEQMLAHILPVSPRRLGLLNDAAITSTLERYALESVAVPTLVASVEDDLFGTFDAARYTANQIPGARFVGYASGGHVWVGRHEALMSEIEWFLREIRSRNDPR
jgi:2-hydroxy-6-oxonona-2,4-dienedioate hydrolase